MAVKIFQSFIQEVKCVILSVLIICLYPLLAVVLFPFFVRRSIVKQIAKHDPKLGDMLGAQDAHFAAHNTYTKPTCVLSPFAAVSSKIDRNHVIKMFTERILKPKDNGGICWFPQLTQKIVTRHGYLFWHQVDDFSLEKHIKYLNPTDPDQIVTRPQLNKIIDNDVAGRPFDPTTSPWELFLIPNFQDEDDPETKSLLMYRFHHCILDGFSLMNYWQKASLKPWKSLGANTKSFKPSRIQLVMQFLRLLFTGPYHLLKMVKFSKDSNEWVTKFDSQPTRLIVRQDILISLDLIKSVKNRFNVNLSSVMIALMIEGMTRAMKKTNMKSIPSKIHVTLPTPLPGHPERFTNHWGVVRLPVTIYKDDPIKTLQGIDKKYENIRQSIIPFVGLYLLKIVGSLPVSMIPTSNELIKSTCLLSNFPGPLEQVDMFGYEVRSGGFGGTPPKGHAISSTACSYNGFIRFRAGTDICNLPREGDAALWMDSFKDAVEDLKLMMVKS